MVFTAVRWFDGEVYTRIFTYLIKVDRKVNFVVLHATRQRGTLPPVLRTIDGILRRVAFVGIVRIANIANLALCEGLRMKIRVLFYIQFVPKLTCPWMTEYWF